MDQRQLIVGMKIVVVSATHAFKTLLLSRWKKRISLSFLAIVVISFSSSVSFFFSFLFYFASHYYSASRRTITFLMRSLQPVTKIFFFLSLSFNHRTIYLGTRLILTNTNRLWYIRWTNEKLNAIFYSSLRSMRSHGYQMDTSPWSVHRVQYRASRKPHTPLTWAACYKSTPTTSLVTRRLIARLYLYLNSISLSLSPRTSYHLLSSLFW